MSEDCIFCKIIDGELPSRKVYEDDKVLSFLDVNPLSRGHTLVIPKNHSETLEDLDDEYSEAVFSAVRDLVEPVTEAVDADAANVGINNGEAAGQEVPHLHAHIVPRFEGDGGGPIHNILPSTVELEDDEMDEIAESISGNVE
ncbi:HIT family protein [Halorutilales archaeon Cl-col2-1]